MNAYIPHGICLANERWLIMAHVTSDVMIWLAYMVISAILIYTRRRLEDFIGRELFAMFGVFIFLCGMTHLFDAVIVWHPIYRVQAAVKVLTAFASVATGFVLVRMKLALRRGDHG